MGVTPQRGLRMAPVQTRNPKSSTCPRCFGTVETTRTEVVCSECGLVVDADPINHDTVRQFADRPDRRRVAPTDANRGDAGLGSEMGTLKDREGADHRRATWHDRIQRGDHKDRNRNYATSEIERIGVAVGLPRPVIDAGTWLFRRVHRESLEGHDLDAWTAGCLYVACRRDGMGRVPGEIAPAARCSERQIERAYYRIIRRLEVEVPPPNVAQRVRVVGAKLPVDSQAVVRAVSRLEALDDQRVASGGVSTAAAYVLYDVTDCTQREVADAAGCTPAALRNRRDQLSSAEQ